MPDYKAMLLELLRELDAYERAKSRAERRFYDWWVNHKTEPEWAVLLTEVAKKETPDA